MNGSCDPVSENKFTKKKDYFGENFQNSSVIVNLKCPILYYHFRCFILCEMHEQYK